MQFIHIMYPRVKYPEWGEWIINQVRSQYPESKVVRKGRTGKLKMGFVLLSCEKGLPRSFLRYLKSHGDVIDYMGFKLDVSGRGESQ